MVKDVLGGYWQFGTIQVVWILPGCFELKYIGSESMDICPVTADMTPLGTL